MRTPFVFYRYLVKNYLRWFFMVLAAIVIIVALFDGTELMRRAALRSDISIVLILKMIVLKLPSLLEIVSPFIVFFGSLLTFWNLNRHHELEIAKAAGISIWQILTPLVGVNLLIGLGVTTLLNPVFSHMKMYYEQLNNHYLNYQKESLSISESGLWIREASGGKQSVFHIQHISMTDKKLSKIIILETDLQNHFIQRIDAQTGRMEEGKLMLSRVWVSSPHIIPQYSEEKVYGTHISMTLLNQNGIDANSLSFWSLPYYCQLLEKSGLSSTKYRLYWHSLIARWLWLGVMVILAATCASRSMRGGGFARLIASGVLISFALYFFKDITQALGNAENLPVLMAAWIPTIVSAIIGVSILLSLEDG